MSDNMRVCAHSLARLLNSLLWRGRGRLSAGRICNPNRQRLEQLQDARASTLKAQGLPSTAEWAGVPGRLTGPRCLVEGATACRHTRVDAGAKDQERDVTAIYLLLLHLD